MVSTGNLVDPATVNKVISWIGVLSLPGNIATASDAAAAAPNALEAVGLYYIAEYVQGDPVTHFKDVTTDEWNIINQSIYLADQASAQTLFSAAQQANPAYAIVPGQAFEVEISGVQYTGQAQIMSISVPFTYCQYSSVVSSQGTPISVSLNFSITLNTSTESPSASTPSEPTAPLPPTTPHFP